MNDVKKMLVEQYIKKVPDLLSVSDPYICFYRAWFNNGNIYREPWACMSVTKFDTEECEGELSTLDTHEILYRAKTWARKHLGAKFEYDDNPDGTTVPAFHRENSSANCEIIIEALPFNGIRKQQD